MQKFYLFRIVESESILIKISFRSHFLYIDVTIYALLTLIVPRFFFSDCQIKEKALFLLKVNLKP